jgi:hypothetical protein
VGVGFRARACGQEFAEKVEGYVFWRARTTTPSNAVAVAEEFAEKVATQDAVRTELRAADQYKGPYGTAEAVPFQNPTRVEQRGGAFNGCDWSHSLS